MDVADKDIQSYVEKFVNGAMYDYNQQLRALNYGFEGDKDLEQTRSEYDKAYNFILAINIKKLVKSVVSIYNSFKGDLAHQYRQSVIADAVIKAIPYKAFKGWDCLSHISKNFIYIWFDDELVSSTDIVKARHTLFWEVGHLNYVIMIELPLSKSQKIEIFGEIENKVVENLRKLHKEWEAKYGKQGKEIK